MRKANAKSFTDAAKTSEITPGMIKVLDQVHESINSYSSGLHNLFCEEGRINYQIVLIKYSNEYYSGIETSTHMYDSAHFPVFFSYANSTTGFSLFLPQKIE